MQQKIFYSIFSACFLLLLIVNIFLIFSFEAFLERELFLKLESSAKQVKDSANKYINGELKYISHHRLTIINNDGEVLYDNFADISKLDNHILRHEVQEAFKNGVAKSIRYSDTLQEKTLYYALMHDNLIIRLSNTHDYLFGSIVRFMPYFIVEFFAFLFLSLLLAKVLTRKILKPIIECDIDSLSKDSSYKELHSFVKKIKFQNKVIKQKQKEILLLIENMSDGIIWLNRHGNILSVNKSVSLYFSDIESTLSIYQLSDCTFLKIALEALEEFKKNKQQENKILQLKIAHYECEVVLSSIILKNKFKGMVIVIRNITEKKIAQKLQREFSANVTHELKTPLTSILASSEMIRNKLVAKEDLDSFVDRIYCESRRLLSMIDEILKISFFYEGKEDRLKKIRINLKNIVERVSERLSLIAKGALVIIKLDVCDCHIFGVEDLIEDSIFNICHNAIRYNKPNGEVLITLHKENDAIKLSIKDTGIGIPQDSLPRIFERFFCVDKGRSKKLGGSGLGLSIVDTALKYHNATIDVKSEVGIGSEFIITFKEVES